MVGSIQMMFPQHEQNYPSLLLPHRLEEYVRDDAPPTVDRRYAVMVTGQQVLDAIELAKKNLGKLDIDSRYFVGTVFHESGCLNEWDTEVATTSSPHGFVSVGPYQIGDEEARTFNYRLSDMIDLGKASDCMLRLALRNLSSILGVCATAAGLGKVNTRDYVDPKGQTWVDGGVRAYLAIAHNHGNGYARATILNYGLDWARYKARNPHDHIVDHGYGEDCVTGGPKWPGTKA
jgi:hypothetical protein